MNSIFKQCRELYNTAFGDDGAFADMLFSLFSKDLRYITENGKLVCMAFCIDVFAQNKKGKYLYAVATDKNFRNKGYMSRLFKNIEEEFSGEYDFLCLHPANESLIELYKNKGFTLNLIGGIIKSKEQPLILIENEQELKGVLKKVLPEESIEFSEEYLKLLLLYARAFCDSKETPTKLCIKQNNGEVLAYFNNETTKAFKSMSKPLKDINLENYCLAITLE